MQAVLLQSRFICVFVVLVIQTHAHFSLFFSLSPGDAVGGFNFPEVDISTMSDFWLTDLTKKLTPGNIIQLYYWFGILYEKWQSVREKQLFWHPKL